jgi:hypothetical protein
MCVLLQQTARGLVVECECGLRMWAANVDCGSQALVGLANRSVEWAVYTYVKEDHDLPQARSPTKIQRGQDQFQCPQSTPEYGLPYEATPSGKCIPVP